MDGGRAACSLRASCVVDLPGHRCPAAAIRLLWLRPGPLLLLLLLLDQGVQAAAQQL